jgi:hypothetical protein
MRRYDKVSWMNMYLAMLIEHTRRAPLVKIKCAELPIVKASMETTV